MNKTSLSSSLTTRTVTAITVVSAVLLVSALVVIPIIEQAHALDLKKLSDQVESFTHRILDRIGNGHHQPPG
jgi:hypothetical protein